MDSSSDFTGHRPEVTREGGLSTNGSSADQNNASSVHARAATAAVSLDPVALAVDLPPSLSSKVRSADEMLSADKINTRSLQTWNPFLNGGASDYAPLLNPKAVDGKIRGGRYEKPNELFDAKTIVPVKMILEGFAKLKPDIQPLVDAIMPAALLRRPAHKFNIGGKLDTRVVLFGGKEAGDPQHTHIDAIVHELGKKHLRVILQWAHPADYSLSQSTQGGTPADILGNTYMPAGSSHINLFSTGMIDGKPVVVTSNWGDDSRIDDVWPQCAVHLLAIDYQAGVEDPVPDETLAAWKRNADMWDCFAAMLVPFAGDDPFGYTKYQWNPLEVHNQASAAAVAEELANLDWDTFKTKYGAFYCAEAQYSVANLGPQEATQLKASRFASTRIGRIIKTFGEAPGYAGKDIAWKRAHPEIGWEWLTQQGKANGGIDIKEFVRLGYPKTKDVPETFTRTTYSNRIGVYLEFIPENIKGWQAYRPRNRDGLFASPLSVATTAWSLVRSYLPRQKIADTIQVEIMRAYRSGAPAVQAVVKGLTGGADPEAATGQAALGQVAAALAGRFLVAALTDDSDLDSEFKRDVDTGQPTADKSKWTYVSTAQKTMLEKAGYKELASDADRAKVKKVWDDFLAVLTNPDNASQEKLDAALLTADREAKTLRVRREPLVKDAPAYDGLMCFVPPGCWAMWAQQPFYSEAYSVRYIATCVHKSISSDAALKFADRAEPLPPKPEVAPKPKVAEPEVTAKPEDTPKPPVTDTRPSDTPVAAPRTSTGSVTLADEILALLAKPPPLSGIDIDIDAFRAFSGVAQGGGNGTARTLLPDGYQWKAGEKVPRVPLQLCEFLAYKTSLAYESEERIKSFLETGHEGITRFKFFTSSNGDAAGKLADAQGYGFVFEGKAFVIFRGTESGNDWGINRLDTMTDGLSSMSAKARKKLEGKYGSLLASLGEPSPGRHVGFSIAWAAIKPQVEDWLADVLTDGDAMSIVYSGHSLGGAMAQIAAFDHARKLEGNPAMIAQRFSGVVTFGAPMVGGPAFAEHYERLLGDRTVLVESSGDLVPRIMQRWYYRMLYPLRQWALAGLNAKAKQDATRFASVAPAAWMFSSEPPLSAKDIDNAIAEFLEVTERAAKEAAEAQKKANQQAKPAGSGSNKAPGTSTGSSAGSSAGQNVAGQSHSSGGVTGKAEPAPTWVYWAVAGVFVIVGAGVAWYFVRRKLYSHDIEQRYALYLSTLSYQQLRGGFGGDLARANSALDEHMRFVRGDMAKVAASSKTPYFKSVQNLPVKIEVKETPAFVEYLKSGKAFL